MPPGLDVLPNNLACWEDTDPQPFVLCKECTRASRIQTYVCRTHHTKHLKRKGQLYLGDRGGKRT